MPDIKPGDIRTFKKENGNALVLALGVWADKDKAGWIRIDLTGPRDFHTTVTNNPDSERFHRTLFRDLRQVLISEKCWRFGEEGSETEARAAGGIA